MQKSSFRWEVLPAKMRNRRDILFSFADFVGNCVGFAISNDILSSKKNYFVVVSFGGAATLFLGINCFQISKIIYKILEKILNMQFPTQNQRQKS